MNNKQNKIKVLFFLNILRKGAGMINREAAFAEELNKNGYDVSILSYFKPEMKLHGELNFSRAPEAGTPCPGPGAPAVVVLRT